jgi:hypothetical protein
MESKIIHEQLNNNDVNAKHALVCYLQYLIDFRRDVPDKDEYVIYEMQSLLSTKYVVDLQGDDPLYQILHSIKRLEPTDENIGIGLWNTLKNDIGRL